ncbi:hypothetical protein OGAPHI_006326 [Ogataea philodendri]|uniref:Gamma-glutamyltransferase n=1 Tax=Ogataea philodendri TaxID=1378263 RepID=A0A9P8NXX6_9ASCO|nr:uncharacterized protein OGAPHI_006326 [Ogataea philodendri]KAH3661479.1 hypothetical protein OGAPHI_006326 [Ogataea philodendri]
MNFNSRRSTVYSTRGIVSSTQPLANEAGLKVLRAGGNCVDACVAVAAVLCLTEPMSTGIGGCAFGLFYDNTANKVFGINAAGKSAAALSLDWLKENHPDHIKATLRLKDDSVFAIQVPGIIAGWCDAVDRWGSGKVSLAEILAPAIDLAENGYVISQQTALLWKGQEAKLKRVNKISADLAVFLPNQGFSAPVEGQFLQNAQFAETLRKVAQQGKAGFYKGDVARDIVAELQSRGHVMTLEDLASHESQFVEPICVSVLGHKLWEIPPNGSGIIALLALGYINQLDADGVIDLQSLKHNSTEYLHVIIECLKLAFRDSDDHVHDYRHYKESTGIDLEPDLKKLLHSSYFSKRTKHFSKSKVLDNNQIPREVPDPSMRSDTVYLTVSDSDGNAFSFINSLYHHFGSGIVVPKHGFILQNRGDNFNLNPASKNCLAGGKRAYHTIIPGMITKQVDDKELLYASYGIMGGFNQPQAHVQVYLNMLLFGMKPQEALDAPRLCLVPHPDFHHTDNGLGSDGPVSTQVSLVNIEDGVAPEVVAGLRSLGHEVRILSNQQRSLFGRGQIIRREPDPHHLVYSGGSDPRGDGASVPFY